MKPKTNKKSVKLWLNAIQIKEHQMSVKEYITHELKCLRKDAKEIITTIRDCCNDTLNRLEKNQQHFNPMGILQGKAALADIFVSKIDLLESLLMIERENNDV